MPLYENLLLLSKNLKYSYCIFPTKWKLVFSFFFLQSGSQIELSTGTTKSFAILFLSANKIKRDFELLYEANSENILSAKLLIIL